MSKFSGIYTEQPLTRKVIDSHISKKEVKENLRFDDPDATHDNDEQIQGLIEAAREAAENFPGRVFSKSEFTQVIYNYSGNTHKIQVAPFIKMVSIIADGVTLTNGTHYNIKKYHTHFEVYFETTVTADELNIKFHAGYETPDLPPRVKQFIIVEASDGYDTDRTKYTYQVTDSKLQQRCLAPFIITRY